MRDSAHSHPIQWRLSLIAYGIGLLVSLAIAITFSSSILVGDEVFITFGSAFELSRNPLVALTSALDASSKGWETGRYTSPILHVFSNGGVLATEVLGQSLGLDLLASMRLARVVMYVAIVLSVMLLIQVTLRPLTSKHLKYLIVAISGISVAISGLTNNPWGSPRMGTWSYGVALVLMLLGASCTILVLDKSQMIVNKFWRIAITTFVGLIFGLYFATTYELTQILFPVVLFGVISVAYQRRNLRIVQTSSAWNMLRKSIFCTATTSLLIGFVVPFLLIRLNSLTRCVNGCYGTADIRPGGLSLQLLWNQVLNDSVIFQTLYIFNANPDRLTSVWVIVIVGVIAGGLISAAAMAAVFLLQPTHLPSIKETRAGISVPFMYGALIFIFITLGLISSREVQESSSLILGISGRQTIYIAIGFGLIVSSFALSLLFSIRRETQTWGAKIIQLGLPALILLLVASTTISVNLLTTKLISSGDAYRIQKSLAIEMSAFDLSQQGNARRCFLVSDKLKRFPEWLNHDRIWVGGLNSRAESHFGTLFCDIPMDELFAEYSGPA